MLRVSYLLAFKNKDVWTIGPEEPVLEAIQLMADKHIGALPVVRDQELVGIVSERDYARKVILQGHSSQAIRVATIMTKDVITARLDDSVETCMAVMTERRIRHLPVVEDGRTVGMISIGDLVRAVIAEQRFVIAQLESYVTQ